MAEYACSESGSAASTRCEAVTTLVGHNFSGGHAACSVRQALHRWRVGRPRRHRRRSTSSRRTPKRSSAGCPRAPTADIDRRRRRRPRRVRRRRVAPHAPAERIATVQRFADIYAGAHDGHGRSHHRGDGLADHRSRSWRQSPAPWMMLNTFIDDRRASTRGRSSAPACSARASSCAASRVGVVAAIVPWNVPQFVTMSKLAPALLVGLHDRDQAVARDAARRLPHGRAARGGRHPEGRRHRASRPAARSASTSCATPASTRSRSPARPPPAAASPRSAASSSSACSLELGGKSAAIILDDADLGDDDRGPEVRVADEQRPGLRRADPHPRQPRAATTRWSTRWATMVGGMKVGDPTDPATEIGPLVAERQQERVEKYIALGQEEGARVVVGGNGRPDGLDKGWYVQPTVFADVDQRHAHRAGGDLRSGPRGHPLRRRRRRGAHRQRQRVRPGRLGVDRRRRRRASTSPAGSAPAPTASTSTRWTSSRRSAATRPPASAASSARKASSTTSS